MPAPAEVRSRYTPEPHIGLAADGLIVLPGTPAVDQKVRGRIPRIVPVTMVLALVSVACAPQVAQGGQSGEVFVPGVGKAGVSTPPDAGTAPGSPQIEVQPSPVAPGSGEGPKPKRADLPPEAKQFLGNLEEVASAKPDVLSSEDIGILTKAFAERDWPNADTERKRWGAYSNLYGSLWARYNVTQDQAIKAEMGKIEEFMKNTWSSFYPAAVRGGNFLRE